MPARSNPPRAIPFPLARAAPPRTPGGFKELGRTELARALELDDDSLYGHWCRRCEGIWWGLPLEASCPVCSHRGP
jgi:hypothetical protein